MPYRSQTRACRSTNGDSIIFASRKTGTVLTCSLALLLAGLAGCGGGLASVDGLVQLDNKPVAEAGVVFHPLGGGSPASGATDAAGRYRLETGSRGGVAPGEYRVTISKDRMTGARKDGLPTPNIKVEHLVPPRYGKPDTSPLRVSVTPGSQIQNFELTSSPTLP